MTVAVGATPGPTSGRGRGGRPLLSPFGGPPLRPGLGAAQESREHICLPPVCSWGPHGPHQPETARPTGDLTYSWFGGALPSRPCPPLHTQPPLCTLPFNPECTHTHSKVSESQGLDSLKGKGPKVTVSWEVSSPVSALVSSPVTRGCGVWGPDCAVQSPAFGPSASPGPSTLSSPNQAPERLPWMGRGQFSHPPHTVFWVFFKFIFNWRITALQCCGCVCHTTM